METRTYWYKKIEQNLKNPTLIDNSEVEHNPEGSNNIEQTETLEVIFPDGTASAVQGGQENIDKYKEPMKIAAIHGYSLEFRII